MLTSIANSKIIQKGVNWAVKTSKNAIPKQGEKLLPTNYDKIQKYYPLIIGTWVGIVQSFLTYNSNDMPKERKVPLAINIAISDFIGTVGSLLINNKVNKFTERVQNRLDKLPMEEAEKNHLKNGAKTAVPFAISVIMFRYIAQVAATPLAEVVNSYLEKKGIIKYDNKNK